MGAGVRILQYREKKLKSGPDFSAFPCLAYARQAAAAGGTAPAILNAANEVAVAAFCDHRLPFLGISEVVGRVCDALDPVEATSLEAVLDADGAARARAREVINLLGP